MIRTRWQKVIIDLWSNRTRTLIVALAIAVGVYAVGVVMNVRVLMMREFARGQTIAQRSHVVLHTYPFDEDFAEHVAALPEVAAAEGRHVVRTRLYGADGRWHDLVLTSVPDFNAMQTNAIVPMAGAWPPGDRSVILERLALEHVGAEIGDTLTLEMDGGIAKRLTVAGIAHDPQRLSPQISGDILGYVTPETMRALGESARFTELHLRVRGDADDDAYVSAVADRVEKQVEESGRPLLSTRTPKDHVTPIVETLMMIISSFGLMILLLSGFLVINAISALINQQIEQIGVMKLIGAQRRQIVSLYLVTVLVYGLIAVAIGFPLSIVTARILMGAYVQPLLNIVPASYALPPLSILIQIAVGLLLPLIAGLIPVLKGTRITTFQALNDVGVESASGGEGFLEPLLVKLQRAHWLQRPFVLALRNALRHKGRLVQTLMVLIFGTALFIAVLTVRSSVDETVTGFLRFHRYDVSVEMMAPHRAAKLEQIAREVPGVRYVESWAAGGAVRERPDGSESDPFRIYAIPPESSLTAPRPDAGRWLRAGDGKVVVINSDVFKEEPDLRVGDEITMIMKGLETRWEIVGVVPTSAQGPAVYLPYPAYAHATRTYGLATQVQVIADAHDAASQEQIEAALFAAFEEEGVAVAGTETTHRIERQNERFFLIVVTFLVLMALLLAAVGGLGLTTTMSINVIERIREIGVLRAVGASNNAVQKIVLAEGVVVGLISWTVGMLLSVPVSVFMSEKIGMALLDVPLDYRYSTLAAAVWFFALLIIAVVASLGPARRAARLTIREVLAYE